MKIKAGQLLNLTTGDYSDYCLRGTVRALKDFDQHQLVLKFVALNADKFTEVTQYRSKDVIGYLSSDYRYNPDNEFIAWLNKEGYIADVEEVQEWHIGSYNDLSLPQCETT